MPSTGNKSSTRGRGAAQRVNPPRRTNNRQQKPQPGATTTPSNEEAVDADSTAVDKAEPDEEPKEDVCWICAEPYKFYSLSECNHHTCHVCAIRLRALYKKNDCTFCKHPQPTLIFTSTPDNTFQSYDTQFMPFSDSKLAITFETKEMMEETLILLRFNCPDPECDFVGTGWADLKWHVKDRHGTLMCDICIKHKKIFTHEHTLYTPSALALHVPSLKRFSNTKDKEKEVTPSEVHPMCEFCHDCFFGDDELYAHLRERHEECFLCKRLGIQHKYFLNYNKLEQHFRNDHFPCNHATCLEQKFVVFTSQLDLQAHMVDAHGEEMSNRDRRGAKRIDVSFAPADDGRGRGRPGGRGGGAHGAMGRDGPPDPPPPPRVVPGSAPPVVPGGTRRAAFGSQLTSAQVAATPREEPAPREEPNAESSSTSDPRVLEQHAAFINYVESIAPTANSTTAVKACIRSYRNAESSVHDLLSTLYNIFERSMDTTAGVLSRLVDLFEDERRSEILAAWNGMKAGQQLQFPSLTLAPVGSSNYSGITSGQVINVKHSTVNRAGRSNRQLWDRVAQAASTGSASNSGTSTPRIQGVASRSNTPAPPPPGRVVPGSAAYSASTSDTTSFPALSSTGSSTQKGPSQHNTPWLSSSNTNNTSSATSSGNTFRPYSVPAVALTQDSSDTRKKGKQKPAPPVSKELFPELPTSNKPVVPRNFVGGNQSLRSILGEAAVPSTNVWGGGKANGDGSGSGAQTPDESASSNNVPATKGKKKKAKETLFTLGGIPN